MQKFNIVAGLIFLLLVSSCDNSEDEPQKTTPKGTLEINFIVSNKVNNIAENITLEDTFEVLQNRKMVADLIKYYLSNLNVVNQKDENLKINDVILVDFNKAQLNDRNQKVFKVEFSVPADMYKGLTYRFGLDSVTNHSDPTKLPVENPLSVNQGTVWTWATGYRFLMLEGKIDASENGGQQATADISYHIGTDALSFEKKNMDVQHAFEIKENTKTQLIHTLHLDKLLNEPEKINIRAERITHSNVNDIGLAIRLSKNLTNAFELSK